MSYERSVMALAEVRRLYGQAGSVLDVGAGAGAASLPLARWASDVTAVDRSAHMLAAFAERAAGLHEPVPCYTVEGSWPAVAHQVGGHDVVLCHHVVYDVQEIAGFLGALTAAARHRVVLELTPVHPMSWLSPLWLQFHGLVRPRRPTSDDVVAVLHEAGVRALTLDRWTRAETDGLTRAERVEVVTRRLCLPQDREPEVAAALDAMSPAGPRRLVTVAWAGAAPRR
jgi:SAM-dependent methyltransferase